MKTIVPPASLLVCPRRRRAGGSAVDRRLARHDRSSGAGAVASRDLRRTAQVERRQGRNHDRPDHLRRRQGEGRRRHCRIYHRAGRGRQTGRPAEDRGRSRKGRSWPAGGLRRRGQVGVLDDWDQRRGGGDRQGGGRTAGGRDQVPPLGPCGRDTSKKTSSKWRQ